jgi:Mitochondrial carrier protein
MPSQIKIYGLGTLWYGAWATVAATFVGHYPVGTLVTRLLVDGNPLQWFGTYNQLDQSLPQPTTIFQQILRQAFIGFIASVVSDTVSNSLRVVKTYRQVNETRIGYFDAARSVVATDGIRGLLGRGLKTRIIANGAQGLMFSVLWKLFMNM